MKPFKQYVTEEQSDISKIKKILTKVAQKHIKNFEVTVDLDGDMVVLKTTKDKESDKFELIKRELSNKMSSDYEITISKSIKPHTLVVNEI